ncbi:DUF4238 domain-containing protein [Pseudomonas moraviensis]
MAVKKNQHFVPQYYFRFFSFNKKFIPLINLLDGRVIPAASIRDQASKSYFYGDKDMEERIGELEGLFLPSLKKLKDVKTFKHLSFEETFLVLQGVVFQRSRTLAARLDQESTGQEWADMMLEIALNTSDGLTEEDRARLKESVRAVPNMVEIQKIHMIEALSNAHFLADLGMAILKNRTKRSFVFGDAPVVYFNYFQKNIKNRGVLGMRNPGLQIYFPISSRAAIFLYDKNVYKPETNKLSQIDVRQVADVDNLNLLQIHNSASAIYLNSLDDSGALCALWEKSRRTRFNTKGQHRTFTVDHEGQKVEIFHQYDEQLQLVPRLEFCPCPEFAKSEFLIERSTWNGKSYIPEPPQWQLPPRSCPS